MAQPTTYVQRLREKVTQLLQTTAELKHMVNDEYQGLGGADYLTGAFVDEAGQMIPFAGVSKSEVTEAVALLQQLLGVSPETSGPLYKIRN